MYRSFALALCLQALIFTAGAAADYPDHAVKVVVPFPPGSSTDQVARIVAQELASALGQPFVVENRFGAQGMVAARDVATSTADGYTILLTTNSLALAPSLFLNPPFDPVNDFAPVIRIGLTGFVVMVNTSFPAKTLPELIALARAEPGKISAGHSGSGGSVTHAELNALAKINITGVPYRGVPQAITDLLGGTIDVAMVDLGNAMTYARAGKLVPLGLTLSRRTPLAPDVPAISETLPGFKVEAWFGVLAPKGTPTSVVEKLNLTIKQALNKESVREAIALTGTEIAILDPGPFSEFIKSDIGQWRELLELSGIRPQ